MSIIICFNTTQVQYSSPLLDKYCHLVNVICTSYSVNYATKTAITQSNLPAIYMRRCSFNADLCLAKSNLAFISAKLEESFDNVEQTMQSMNSDYAYCTKLHFFKALLLTFLDGLLTLFSYQNIAQEKFLKTIEKECPYGDNKALFIGDQQDWCDQTLESDLALTRCTGIQKDECNEILISYLSGTT